MFRKNTHTHPSSNFIGIYGPTQEIRRTVHRSGLNVLIQTCVDAFRGGPCVQVARSGLQPIHRTGTEGTGLNGASVGSSCSRLCLDLLDGNVDGMADFGPPFLAATRVLGAFPTVYHSSIELLRITTSPKQYLLSTSD